MTPTNRLRFVERKDFTDDPANPVTRRVLQQWWKWEGLSVPISGGEWRDVPLEEEERPLKTTPPN